MTCSIAFAGKGGTGKTTMAGFLIKYLLEKNKTPVLAVDADSNANLNDVLGLEVQETLGDAREEMKKGVSNGMTKDVFMEMKLQEAIVEASGFDLIVMGRPEGAGCYCAANSLLTLYLNRLLGNYEYIVIDNEAGMEHISRLTTSDIDVLITVSDPTIRGIRAADRIIELTEELNLNIGSKYFIINQAREDQEKAIEQVVKEYHLNLIGMVPEDLELQKFDLDGRPTIELGDDSKAIKAAYYIFDKIFSP